MRMEKWFWFSPYGYLIRKSFHKRQSDLNIEWVKWVSSHNMGIAQTHGSAQDTTPKQQNLQPNQDFWYKRKKRNNQMMKDTKRKRKKKTEKSGILVDYQNAV